MTIQIRWCMKIFVFALFSTWAVFGESIQVLSGMFLLCFYSATQRWVKKAATIENCLDTVIVVRCIVLQ